ncbi:MAG: LysR family transcriptional regulator [Hespellia sp.]|nr:LysR family transcriptional regulator [Hespellia sp.]
MFDLNELKQFLTYTECGTLSKASEQLHISQPTLTRSMQHIEDDFGVSLFLREKNKITLNKTGQKAVVSIKKLLEAVDDTLLQIQDYDKSLHTISVESCAPAPLWSLFPNLSAHYSNMSISSALKGEDEIINHVLNQKCDIGIITFSASQKEITCISTIKESLSVCVPKSHDLATKKELTFEELNGFNFLLRSEIGFWDSLCRSKMSSSKFLVQMDESAFNELVRESALPCFTTNLALKDRELLNDRVIIPIKSQEATVTYYMVYLSKNRMKFDFNF